MWIQDGLGPMNDPRNTQSSGGHWRNPLWLLRSARDHFPPSILRDPEVIGSHGLELKRCRFMYLPDHWGTTNDLHNITNHFTSGMFTTVSTSFFGNARPSICYPQLP